MDSGADRRRWERYPVRLRVLFQRLGAAHFVDAETDNISAGGVFVQTTRRPLDVGTRVLLLLKLDNPEKELTIPGVVAWLSEGESSDTDPRGMGIRFENTDAESRKSLQNLLERLERQES